MAKDPAFLFYPGDYLRDTQNFSEKTQVSYDRIMCEHMRNICISQQQLNFFTKRLTEDEKEELMMCLVVSNGGFCIEWVKESIEKRRAYSESRSKNKKGKKKIISKSHDNHMEDEDVIENEDIKEADNGKEFKNENVIYAKFIGLDQRKIDELFSKFEYKFISKDIFKTVLGKIHDRTKEKDSYSLNWFKRCLENFNFADEGMLETVQAASKADFNKEGLKKVLDKIG